MPKIGTNKGRQREPFLPNSMHSGGRKGQKVSDYIGHNDRGKLDVLMTCQVLGLHS